MIFFLFILAYDLVLPSVHFQSISYFVMGKESVKSCRQIVISPKWNPNISLHPYGLWPFPPFKNNGNICIRNIFCCVLLTGPGNFVSAIEMLSGRKAVVAGKPGLLIKDFISKRYPLNPERTLMIGDM